VEGTARGDERNVDNCRVHSWTSYQEVDYHGLYADWEWSFVDVVVAPSFERLYGWKDDCCGYGMKNISYDGGLGKVVEDG
jgi:hypothetical protein